MSTITALVITLNEAKNIQACLESVKWTNEILIIDSGSTDETCALARQYTNKIVSHKWEGYSGQKNFGHSLATSDWILSVDADERVTPELQSEIQSILADCQTETSFDAYRIPIRDWMFGKFVEHGSWPHQQHVRLYRKGLGIWSGTIHEGVVVQGCVGQVSSPLLHYSHTTIQKFIAKLNHYTEIEAEAMLRNGKRVNLCDVFFSSGRAFLGQYVRLQGFRDGGHGLILALLMAFYYFLTRAKAWSMWYIQEHPLK